MKKTSFFGLMAFGFTVAYLYNLRKEKDTGLDGVEIKINPERLLDGALAMTRMNPIAQEGIRRVAKNAIKKYYES